MSCCRSYGALATDFRWDRACARLAVSAVSKRERKFVVAGSPIGDFDTGRSGDHLIGGQWWPARRCLEISPIFFEPLARPSIDTHFGEHLLGCINDRIVGGHPGRGGFVVSVIDRVDHRSEFRGLRLVFRKDVSDRLVALRGDAA
ncbi:hypothetical protein [Mycolicibacter terrae]|uniref:hypothetical protein n=1 Tax=Mycolicibacter terrae TaxID=1788 RepID=UPI0010567F0F|nr:hypothetical protein [Mycolicibacter terrae]